VDDPPKRGSPHGTFLTPCKPECEDPQGSASRWLLGGLVPETNHLSASWLGETRRNHRRLGTLLYQRRSKDEPAICYCGTAVCCTMGT
jgi:hypothetical protein